MRRKGHGSRFWEMRNDHKILVEILKLRHCLGEADMDGKLELKHC
jgi:hypothetical protein